MAYSARWRGVLVHRCWYHSLREVGPAVERSLGVSFTGERFGGGEGPAQRGKVPQWKGPAVEGTSATWIGSVAGKVMVSSMSSWPAREDGVISPFLAGGGPPPRPIPWIVPI